MYSTTMYSQCNACLCPHSGESGSEGAATAEEKHEKLNADELLAMKSLLSKQLVDGVVSLLAEVPLL